jgi:hypothetical protein
LEYEGNAQNDQWLPGEQILGDGRRGQMPMDEHHKMPLQGHAVYLEAEDFSHGRFANRPYTLKL